MNSEMAWAIGIFEGEGSIVWDNRKKSCILQVHSTDKDVLDRFFAIVQAGNLRGPYTKKGFNYKPVWHWSCGKADDIERLLTLWLPWLCSRRKEKAEKTLIRLQSVFKRANSLTCSQGHPWLPDNTYIHRKSGNRQCRKCNADYARNRRKEGLLEYVKTSPSNRLLIE